MYRPVRRAFSWAYTMIEQINFIRDRDGIDGAVDYATRALDAYRKAARYRNGKTRHYCHIMPYRPHFVRSIIEIRQFLREHR
jgi:hypothetical protein